MEVHHHGAHHSKKKIYEYLLEFVMLFLAVTLGFLAENLREHLTEQKKEKEYIASFIADLKKDTAEIKFASLRLRTAIHNQDSLIFLLQHYKATDSMNKKCYKYYLLSCVNVIMVNFNQNAFSQLLNTGSVRLISKPHIMDSIMAYNSITKVVNAQASYYTDEFKKAFEYSRNIYDLSYIHSHLNDDYTMTPAMKYDTASFRLVSTDAEHFRRYASYLIMQQNLSGGYVIMLHIAQKTAGRLITLLQNKYHIKEEE